MSDEKEIEASLQICKEIEDFQIKDDFIQEDSSFHIEKKADTFREIDKILNDSEPEEPETEKEPEAEQSQETVFETEPEDDEPETSADMPEAEAEVDMSEEQNKMPKKQDEMPEKKADMPEKQVEISEENEIHLENMADEIPDTEVGFGGSGEDAAEAEYVERHPFLRTTLSLLVCIVLALVLSLVLTKYVAYHTSVEGSSMEPMLENGDQLIVENISYYMHDPERFDVIVFPYSQGVSYIKRIIGLPGEKVQIKDGAVYINDELISENYGKDTIQDPGLAKDSIVLGADEYFVLGDNRNASIDSRRLEVGTVNRSKIKGKAWLRFYPFDRITTIE